MPESANNKKKLNVKKWLQNKARKELHEYEDVIPESLEKLRALLQEEEHLNCPLDEKFLIRFLRARKFDIGRTKSLIKHYYEMRYNNPDLFKDLCPESLAHVLEQEIQAVLEKRDSQGRHVFIFRAGKWDPCIANLDDIFRSNYLFLEEMTSSEQTQICGLTAIVDFDGMGFYQARQFTPKHAIRMIQIIQNSFPCRIQEFHLVNQPYVFNLVYSVVKPFLNAKIKSRIYFHGQDVESLHQKINPEILPDFLGGTICINEAMLKFNTKVLQNNQHYKDMLQYGYKS